jgi:lipid-binding SYLF domain-containing protein
MKSPHLYLASGLALLALVMHAPAHAQTKAILDSGAAETVKQFNLLDPRHQDLENRAAGMLIFPQVTKGGIALASGYGEGVLQVNGATVGYYSIASASVGLTAGIATHSEIILFMTPDALDTFMQSKGWSIGADTGIAMMSKGMAGDYDASSLTKPILVFMFAEKGVLADLSLQGSKINKIAK